MVSPMNSLWEITCPVNISSNRKSFTLYKQKNKRNFISLSTTDSNNTTPTPSPPNDENTPTITTPPKKPSLTARERLRAARVLSKYPDSNSQSQKPELGKSEFGSRVLEAFKEGEKGKKKKKGSGLPEAPVNMLDDSKRGLPTGKWSINLGLGNDVFLIALSFVLISTVMFATTFLVWKVGAIHFNEY